MSYPKKLLRLQPQRGFMSDTADHEASEAFYTGVENVEFRDGFATRLQGFRDAYEPEIALIAPGEFYHSVNADLNNLNWWLMCEQNGEIHAMTTGVVSKIDAGMFQSVQRPWQYSSSLLNGIPIISNSLDEPIFWSGTGDAAILPDWPATESCKFISVLKYHIFAMNISGVGGEFDNLVRFSAAAEPGTVPDSWTPQADNDAGSVELSDSPGPILCAYPLGDVLYIYKKNATYQARYVGGQNVFAFRKVQSASGALTPRSVCDVGGAHFIVSDGDILLNDGTTRRSVGESRVRDWLFDQLDSEEWRQLFCTYNRAKDEVIVGFPSNGSTYCNRALVYDLSRDAFGVRDLNQTTHSTTGVIDDETPADTWANRTEVWADAVSPWASSLDIAATDSLVGLQAVTFVQDDVNNSTVLNAAVARAGLTFGEPERVKFVKRVHVRTRRPFGTLNVRVGGQMEPNGAMTWSDTVTISGTESIVNAFAVGRYIAVEVRSDDGNVWKITGIDLEAELRGYF
jgi:hypothetical protein